MDKNQAGQAYFKQPLGSGAAKMRNLITLKPAR
jgi:hypothetical protein